MQVQFFSTHQKKFSWFLLVVFISLLYLPFLNNRVVRSAGDDKVYTSQSIEMERAGTWFLQRLADKPDYYKGPLHYILLRVGSIFFGHTMFATVWMNFVWVLLGAIAVASVVERRLGDEQGWSFFAGASFALCSAVYSHVFASQMEVGLAACYALALNYLDQSGPGRDLKFWLICGVAGWLKSPLHAVLIGSSGILFWLLQGELWPRLKDWRAWLAVLAGIVLCGIGYLPAFLLDRQAFWDTYILRETYYKPANGAPWHYPVIPFFTYGLLPWMLPAFVAYADGLSRPLRRMVHPPAIKRLLQLGLAVVVPTVVFFSVHPYRGQNYDTPAMAGLILWISVIWATRTPSWNRIYTAAVALTSVIFLLVPLALSYGTDHFAPMPFWWPKWLLTALWVGAFLTARGVFFEGVRLGQMRPGVMVRRCLWFFLALGALLSTLGERELIDLRLYLAVAKANNQSPVLRYWNVQDNIWCEWGYLNFMLNYPVSALNTDEQVKAAISAKNTILIPGEPFLTDFKKFVDKNFPGARVDTETWRRWRTKGKTFEGNPVWKEAWEKRDISILERPFFITRVTLP